MTHDHQHAKHHGHPYLRLVAMLVLSFIAMYVLMYAMVDKLEDARANWNQAYMAALMTAPMIVIELLLMSAMYKRRGLNLAIIGLSVLLLTLAWFAIRNQWGISDRQFLLSMIPHHSGAILMCREASLTDIEIKNLCNTIMVGQQAEIDQMNAKLGSAN
ncbi:DUF305 domain-containing protein [Taklimakanibacter deserti]|uniref:DUF305 domain-containing protein n=1 Tax=Taklimakanibacter deserti TaxID=2267839 RepID=UPI000E652B54